MRNRFKLMAAALLLLPIIQACGGDLPPPPPTGSIDGLVSIEGQGADGVTVTLSNGGTATTANGGTYRFDGVEAGTYTVTISNFPDEASFDQESAPATIATDGETVTVNFSGTYIRTSSIMGTVTVEDDGLPGITVRLSGVSDSETLTDASGQYAFRGLRAGNYTVEITGFDDEDVAFGSTSSAASVAVGESKVVSFEGTYLRTSGVMGQVTADDQPQEGVTVSLQGRGEDKSVTTNSAGQYSFDALRRGDYAVGISGYDTDEVSFDETSKSVTVAYGETANIPFEGTLLRTAGIAGTVTVEGVGPISGVTVTISGEGESADDVTDNAGGYSFEGLPAGDYSVVISGFDDDEYGFPDGTSATVTVELKETGAVPFEGIMLRTAAIEGTVTVGDNDAPLRGVTVTIEGGPKDEEHETTTNGSGKYQFDRLHAGDYSVSISGYDTREYGFDPTTKTVTVGLRDTGEAAFQGDLLRTAGISGRVRVGDMGLAGVTVTLTGEESREGNTDADGQYNFSGLAAGDYTLTISGWDAVEYAFEPTMDISLELDESKNGVDFEGRALRTATVMGSVTVEGAGLPGIAVTLIKVESANSGTVIGTMATGSDGGYTFGPLLAGAYQVMIAGYADEHDFGEAGTTRTTVVAVDGMATVDFPATIIRTAGVSGMVTLDGEGMADIAVTLTGDHAPDDNSMTTGADGAYSFGGLRKGSYTVTMTNPDEGKYSFPTTSRSMNLSVGQKQTGISFAGASLRRASISGRVQTDNDDAVPGVTVTLSGKADGTETTDANGEYNFPGLAGGTYVVEISGWNEVAYEFPSDSTRKVVDLGDDEGRELDFNGTHTRTASVSGMLFLDEIKSDGKHTEDEPAFEQAGIPLLLQGPKLGDVTPGMSDADGEYAFENLVAGDYRVIVSLADTAVANSLTRAGYRFSGELTGQAAQVAAAAEAKVNFPFRITKQTIMVGAVMGTSKMVPDPPTMVEGVELALWPTVEAADKGDATEMLGTGTMKTDKMGMAKFDFLRSADLGPGGQGKDHLVFATVMKSGHDDLTVADNSHIEIQYNATERVSMATAAARLLNTAVNFQWSVKSVAEHSDGTKARDGDQPLSGWKTLVNDNLVGEGEGDDFKPDTTSEKGMASYSRKIETSDLGDDATKKYTVKLDEDREADGDVKAHEAMQPGDEDWEQSNAVTHTHNGLALPLAKGAEVPSAGTIYVTWTTQTLVVGVYREADDVEGFSNRQSQVKQGDHRPAAGVAAKMSISVMVESSDRRGLEVYDKWDHDRNPKTDPIEATKTGLTGGMATFENLPADMEFTVQFNEGSNRVAVGGPDSRSDRVQAYGDDLDLGERSKGAFGSESGAVPMVELCPLTTDTRPSSLGDKDSNCATFAYQWNTGSITGTIGRAVKGLDVSIEADTEVHSEAPGDTETDKDGEFDRSDVRDGTYSIAVASSNDYTVTPARVRVNVYHDEFTDDKNEDTEYIGKAGEDHAVFTTSRLRLSIKGYAANVSHEENDVVRDDETYEGAKLELYKYKSSTAKIKKTGPVLQTATVDATGLYEFNDLNDVDSYTIVAVNTDDYEMYRDGPNIHYWNNVAAATYGDPDEEDLNLPKWDYEASDVTNPKSEHDLDPDDSDSPKYTFYNFALLHGDGEFGGRVYEAGDNADGAAVELRRCETYTAPDPGADPDPIVENCRRDSDFGVETENADARGRWDFASLREGWYVVNIGARYNRAKWRTAATTTGDNPGPAGIDDDALACDGRTTGDEDAACDDDGTEDTYGKLEGKRAFIRGGVSFYVYDDSKDDATGAGEADIAIEGESDPDAGEVDLPELTNITEDSPGSVSEVITWASKTITITPDIPSRATFEATVTTGSGPTRKTFDKESGEDGDDVTLTLEANKTDEDDGSVPDANLENTVEFKVIAENGYHDLDYSFTVSRANPVDANLTALTLGTTRGGTEATLDPTFAAGEDEYTATVPVGSGAGSTMSVYIRATGKALQRGIEVTHNGDVITAMRPLSNQLALAHDYKITVPRTGSLQGQRVTVAIESEDEVTFTIEINLDR